MKNVVERTPIVNRKVEYFPSAAAAAALAANVSSAKRIQAKLDSVAMKVRQHFDAAGTPLIYYLGHWRTPDDDVWRPLSRLERQELDRVMRHLCLEAGLAFKRWMPLHFRLSQEFAPPGHGGLFSRKLPDIKISDEQRA